MSEPRTAADDARMLNAIRSRARHDNAMGQQQADRDWLLGYIEAEAAASPALRAALERLLADEFDFDDMPTGRNAHDSAERIAAALAAAPEARTLAP